MSVPSSRLPGRGSAIDSKRSSGDEGGFFAEQEGDEVATSVRSTPDLSDAMLPLERVHPVAALPRPVLVNLTSAFLRAGR
jgi:hypothetical protein